MVKENKIEKIIKQAIENCDYSMKEVRSLLTKALKEIQKSKKKKEQNKNTSPNLKLNPKTGVLESMNLTQKRNVLSYIEKMIKNESEKLEPKNGYLISE